MSYPPMITYPQYTLLNWTPKSALRLLHLIPIYIYFILTNGSRSTKLYDYHFRIVNFPYILYIWNCSNIPESRGYSVYISQRIRYTKACSSYGDFIDRRRFLTNKLVDQCFTFDTLKIYFRKFYGRYNDL